jgi:hypothetical protein
MIITDFYIKYKNTVLPTDDFYPKFEDYIQINAEYNDENIKTYFDKLVNCDGTEINYLRKVIINGYIFINIR